MFSHIMVGADDIEASRVFYDAVLGTLGCKPGILSVNPTGHTRYLYIHENNMFIISIFAFSLLLKLRYSTSTRTC